MGHMLLSADVRCGTVGREGCSRGEPWQPRAMGASPERIRIVWRAVIVSFVCTRGSMPGSTYQSRLDHTMLYKRLSNAMRLRSCGLGSH
jgi:hypothetical protein